MQVFLGVARGGQHVLTLYDHGAYHWDYEAEIMSVKWWSDGHYWHNYAYNLLTEKNDIYVSTTYTVAWGFTARITRYN